MTGQPFVNRSVVHVTTTSPTFDEAACVGKVDVMFPHVPEGHTARDYYTEARKLCATCPVLEPCRRAVLSMRPRPKHGMWAGLNPSELRRLLEERRAS